MQPPSVVRFALSIFMLIAFLASAVAVSAQAPPDSSEECPPGWVPRPEALNLALGPCVPGAIASNPVVIAVLDDDPGTCQPGFVPRPQELNPALGPCIPGSIAANTFLVPLLDTDPTTCSPGWRQAIPPLNPQLGCVPVTEASESGLP